MKIIRNTLLFIGGIFAPFAVIILVPVALVAGAICSIASFGNLIVAGINNE